MNSIKHLKHHEIDKDAYNLCIEQSPQGTVYAMSWYLDTVSPGWELLVSGNYEIVMPLPVKKKFGIKYATQPRLCQQLGIFTRKSLNINTIESFIEKIPYANYKLQLNSGNIFEGLEASFRKNYLLNLNCDYEKIKAGYGGNCSKNIRKAERESLTVNHNMSQQEYMDFIANNAEKRPILNILHLLENILKCAHQHATVQLWNVCDENQTLLACIFFLFWKNRVYYLVPTSSVDGKRKHGMSFLIDSFIRSHARSSIILDFEGSSLPGVAKFYEGFGAIAEIYPLIEKKDTRSKIYTFLKNSMQLSSK